MPRRRHWKQPLSDKYFRIVTEFRPILNGSNHGQAYFLVTRIRAANLPYQGTVSVVPPLASAIPDPQGLKALAITAGTALRQA